MTVLGKLVDVLRSGQYTPEKGKFHSYLATMIVNEVHMSHRREIARASDRKVSIDSSVPGGAAESSDRTIADTIAAPEVSPERLDADWRLPRRGRVEDGASGESREAAAHSPRPPVSLT